MSGIRGDFRTYTSFRCLISETNSEAVVTWVWHMALPLPVSLFAPSQHRQVLAAFSVINIDAGIVQEQVLRRHRKHIWKNGKIRFCYYHEIKQKFQTEVLTHTPARLQDTVKTEVLARLKHIFTKCENAVQQQFVLHDLQTVIRNLECPTELRSLLLEFCRLKFGKWSNCIGLV